MKKTSVKYILSMIFVLLLFPARAGCAEYESYAICYDAKPPVAKLLEFDAVVLDPKVSVDIKKLRKKGVSVFSYLSVGEINKATKEYKLFLDKKIMVAENPDWKGSFYVDVSSSEWRDHLIETAIPEIVKKGFNGLFLDTLDSPLRLMASDPKKYPKMNEYLCELIKEIRNRFPKLEIIANNFEEHADEIGPYVDGFNVEELISAYNFKTRTYGKIGRSESLERIRRLKKVSEKYDVQIFVVDYVSPGNKKMAVHVYNKIKELGFVPYISTVDLDKISSHMIYLNENYSQEL